MNTQEKHGKVWATAFLMIAVLVLSLFLTGCDAGRAGEEGASARGTTHFGNMGVAGEMGIVTSGIVAEQTSLTMGMTTDTGTATGADAYLGNFTMTMDDADADLRGILMTAAASANAAAASYEYGFAYDCAEDTATTCTDGIILTSSGVNLGMTDGLDASAANILNAVNVGSNQVMGGNSDFFTIGATDATLIVARNDSGAVTFTCVDDDANADCVYDSGGTGAVTIGSADSTNVTVNSDVGLTFANNSESIADLTDAAFDFTRNDAGVVTLTCSDDDATAGCVYDAGGASPIVIGSADVTNVTLDSDVGLTFSENSDSLNNLTDAAFNFSRDDAGVVTITSSDDDAIAGMIYDAGGASPITIGSADVTNITVNSDVGLTFAGNTESINNLTDAFFDFTRNDAGIVTLMCSDDDAVAGCTYDAGGASPIIIGSADVTNITVDSDVGLTFAENSDSVNNLTDAAFDFTRDDAGIVTLTASDDDAIAGMTLDAGGASPIVIGSADVTLISLLPDNDVSIINGATGDVVLNYHDYADSADDDMAHATVTVNCTTATTGAEDCDYSVGVVEGGAAAEIRFALDADGGVDIGSANVDDVTSVAGATTAILAAPPTAGSGGDFWDLTSTFGIADGTDIMVGFDMNLTGAAHTGDGNRMCGLDIDMTTADAQVPATAIEVNDLDFDYAIDAGSVPIVATAQTWMEDFFGDTLATELVLLNGTDGQALDPALSQAQFGTVVLEGGDSNANVAADGSEMALGLHWSADQSSLIMEARVYVDDITTVAMCVGLSDSIALEVPLTIAGGDAITGVADDWVGFCYDTDSDADEWFFVGFDATVEATGSGAVGVAPVNGIFQTLRIEVDSGGEDARGYINGTLVGTLTANVVTTSDLLSPIAVIQPLVAAVRDLVVDYVFVSAQRQ